MSRHRRTVPLLVARSIARLCATLFVTWSVLGSATVAHAQGQWTSYIHPASCNDLIVLGDTVWVASGQAGLLHYSRRDGIWSSITRQPSGIAGNDVRVLTYDRTGNLFAGIPGKGLSRLDTDGRWSLINAFDGLPSDTVLCMRAQGDTVWIGTTRGLAIYDGKGLAGSIPDLGTTSPFLDDHINGVEITGDSLFVSTAIGVQFARLSERLRTWTTINDGLPVFAPRPNNGSVSLQMFGLMSDGHTVLALASGANPDNPVFNTFTTFRWSGSEGRWRSDFPANASVRRLRDDFGVLLATTPGGVFRWNSPGAWTLLAGSPATDNGDAAQLEVAADATGHVFASTGGRLLEQGTPAWRTFTPPGPPGNDCRNVANVGGTVYACFEGNGVGRLRGGVWRTFPGGVQCQRPGCNPDTTFLSSSFPKVLLVDPLGPKWIGIWDGPLAKFDDTVEPPRFTNIVFQSGDNITVHLHSTTHGYAADLNHLTPGEEPGRWFGLDTDVQGDNAYNPLGLDVYDTTGTFIRNFGTTYPGIYEGLIRALVVDRSNQMWIGFRKNSTAGLSTFPVPPRLSDLPTITAVPGSGALNVFGLAAHGDSVWVLADDGLHRFDQSARSFVTTLQIAAPPALFSVHPVDVGPDGTVYAGTTGGLRMHRRGVPAVDFNADNSPLADNEVRSVYVDSQGVVWIATAGGLNSFDPDYLPPPQPRLSSLRIQLYPNPAWVTGIGAELHLSGGATAYEGEIYDLNGRMVHRFKSAGNGRVIWNGRDLDQRWVDPGVYFVRARAGGAEATSRVVLLR